MIKYLFCSGLAMETSEADLREFFAACGEIRKIYLPRDKTTGQPRGIAFVTFETPSGFLQGMARDRDLLLDKEVKVKQNEPLHSTCGDKLARSSHAFAAPPRC